MWHLFLLLKENTILYTVLIDSFSFIAKPNSDSYMLINDSVRAIIPTNEASQTFSYFIHAQEFWEKTAAY